MVYFRLMKCELGVYINKTTDPCTIDYARDLAQKVPGAEVLPVTFPLQRFKKTPERIMVVGGEGSVNVLTQYLYDRGETRPTGLLPGVENNVTRTELIESGAVATFDQFMDISFKYKDINLFRPLVFRGKVANNQIGFGRIERAFGYYNEVYKGHQLRRLKTLRAAVDEWTGMGLAEDILNIYSAVSHIGRLRVFPNQDRQGPDITHAWIEGDSFKARLARLYLTFLFWQVNMTPPQIILKTEKLLSYLVKSVPGEAWIDGDTMDISQKGNFLIRRSRLAIPFVAIAPEPFFQLTSPRLS